MASEAFPSKMQLCTKCNFVQNATLHKLEMLKVIFSSLCTCVLQNHSLQSQNSEILKPAYQHRRVVLIGYEHHSRAPIRDFPFHTTRPLLDHYQTTTRPLLDHYQTTTRSLPDKFNTSDLKGKYGKFVNLSGTIPTNVFNLPVP